MCDIGVHFRRCTDELKMTDFVCSYRSQRRRSRHVVVFRAKGWLATIWGTILPGNILLSDQLQSSCYQLPAASLQKDSVCTDNRQESLNTMVHELSFKSILRPPYTCAKTSETVRAAGRCNIE